jgi:hypothetical protein
LLGSILAAAQGSSGSDRRAEVKFQPNGVVKLELSAGDWTVRAGASDKIVITLHGSADEIKRVKVGFDVNGTTAKLTVSETPDSEFHGEIELPARSDLMLRLTAGDLKVQGIDGSKDIANHAGDVDIEIGNADDYGEVDLSVGVGDLNAAPFGESSGGFFGHVQRDGTGPYSLRAHLDAGDLRILGRKRERL